VSLAYKVIYLACTADVLPTTCSIPLTWCFANGRLDTARVGVCFDWFRSEAKNPKASTCT